MTSTGSYARSGGDADCASSNFASAAAGDEAAFGRFYDMVIDRTYGVVNAVVRDRSQSEEIAQNVMVELWRFAPRWNPTQGSAVVFAVTIAHRRAVDLVRSEEARRAREDRYAEWGRFESADDDPATIACGGDDGAVSAALERLPPMMREPIILAFFRGMTHQQIADHLGEPLGTIKSRIRIGLGRLRTDLEVPQALS